jgi:membrane protein implicated in regulation of membrane protease activity
MSDEARTKTVPVEVRDPELSERANEIMTQEARAALGTDHVELPEDRARDAGRAQHDDHGALAILWERRILLGVLLGAAVVVAGILVLATGTWWLLFVPLALHVATTAVVVIAAIATTTDVESPSPTAAAALEEEGVRDPERVFAEEVQSFTPPPGGARSGNTRDVEADEDPAQAHAEQQSAMTPSSRTTNAAPAEPGPGGAEVPDAVILWPAYAAAALMVGAVIIALVGGNALLWILVPVVWPLGIALIVYQLRGYRQAREAQHEDISGREEGAAG